MLLCTVQLVLLLELSFSPSRGPVAAVLLHVVAAREIGSPVEENEGNVDTMLGDGRAPRPKAGGGVGESGNKGQVV